MNQCEVKQPVQSVHVFKIQTSEDIECLKYNWKNFEGYIPILFIGLNVGGGIEVSTERYIQSLVGKCNQLGKKVLLVQLYEQGLRDDQIIDILNLPFARIFINEYHQKFVNIIHDFKKYREHFPAVILNIHSESHLFQNEDVSKMSNLDAITSPIQHVQKMAENILQKKQFVIPFVQDYDDRILPYYLRQGDAVIQKRFGRTTIDIEKLEMFLLSAEDYIKNVSIINTVIDEETLKKFAEESPVDVVYKGRYKHYEVKTVYSQYKYLLHFVKDELFSIVQIDQMANGTIPISQYLKGSFMGRAFPAYGVWQTEYETLDQFAEKQIDFIKKLESNPSEQHKYQINMQSHIRSIFNYEQQASALLTVLGI